MIGVRKVSCKVMVVVVSEKRKKKPAQERHREKKGGERRGEKEKLFFKLRRMQELSTNSPQPTGENQGSGGEEGKVKRNSVDKAKSEIAA